MGMVLMITADPADSRNRLLGPGLGARHELADQTANGLYLINVFFNYRLRRQWRHRIAFNPIAVAAAA
jgi:hypothetical protein